MEAQSAAAPTGAEHRRLNPRSGAGFWAAVVGTAVVAAAVAAVGAGAWWIAALGPAPLGTRPRILHHGGGSRRAAPAPLRDGRRALASAGALRQTSIRAISNCSFAYEDKRFRAHAGVDPLALLRAGGQFLAHGHILSGGSTLTMQVARLLEPRARAVVRGQAAPDRARRRDRAAPEQGRGAGALPEPRALWRQSRRHPRGVARLFRQGAEAADARRSGAAGGPAAVAGSAPARSLRGGGPRARATAYSTGWRPPASSTPTRSSAPRPSRCRRSAGRCRCWRRMPPTRPWPRCRAVRVIQPDHRCGLAGEPRGACARAGENARAGYFGRDPGRRAMPPATCWRGSAPPIISTPSAPARST